LKHYKAGGEIGATLHSGREGNRIFRPAAVKIWVPLMELANRLHLLKRKMIFNLLGYRYGRDDEKSAGSILPT
jgi:hypothetical protein